MKNVAFLIGFLVSGMSALAFGGLGHKTIAKVAESRLPEPIKAKIHAILKSESISDAAVWPDEIREKKEDAFNEKHPGNAGWHFVNLPLGTKKYESSAFGSKTNDVVHSITLCIDVLEGRSSEMSKRDALSWLVHMVGDIHQPLHVACGYYSFTPEKRALLIRDPKQAEKNEHDKGANRLRFGDLKLHGHWDTGLIEYLGMQDGSKTLQQIVEERTNKMTSTNSGDHRHWAEDWATKAIKVSNDAYEGVTLGSRHDLPKKDWFIDVRLSGGVEEYNKANRDRMHDQLARAAFNLSELLKAIMWK
ncbi:MAG: hypothetical protein JWM68_1554 [Verrucomicrobiales bacterium]|nr:hypothetical protein [Verrucomicrobiales bacterium]